MAKNVAAQNAQAQAAAASSKVDDAFLQARKNALEKEAVAMKEANMQEIEELKSRHAQASKDDREKIVQLETRLKEEEAKNSDLERQLQILVEETSTKDRTIEALN